MNSNLLVDSMTANSPQTLKAMATADDPKAFLARQDIQISDKVAQLLLTKPRHTANMRQAFIVHVDL